MRRIFLLAVAVTLSACGFHLRGSYAMSFDTLYIALPETQELRAVLKRNIEASSQVRVVNEAKGAQAMLSITADLPAKNVLSLDSAGRVREFQLVRTVGFRLQDADKRDLLPPGQIVIRRDITFNDAQVLSKESEEALLWRDIQDDLVQQMLRRLAAAKAKPAGG
jgi:LPS-assembly lipoprotein